MYLHVLVVSNNGDENKQGLTLKFVIGHTIGKFKVGLTLLDTVTLDVSLLTLMLQSYKNDTRITNIS